MRVSKRYKLGRTQAELDFVDVDIVNDTPFFLDPRALRLSETDWSHQCVSLLRDYFKAVLAAVQGNDRALGLRLLGGLHEPNETHLGFSAGKSSGSAVGEKLALELWNSLSANAAVTQSGLLEDLDETALLVPGIDRDRISDIATNVIREPLIHYTQAMCDFYGIKREQDVDSGPIWSPTRRTWISHHVELPVVPSGKLLLVPKTLVRRKLAFNHGAYFNREVLGYLEGVELAAGSELVETLKSGRKRVPKKVLKQRYGTGKPVATELTRLHPQMLEQFRKRVADDPPGALPHDVLAADHADALPDWDGALAALAAVPTGRAGETAFERAIEDLLTMVMHGSLAFPVRQHKVHDGRKRIDISFSNVAPDGFFKWLMDHFPAAHVVVECKNYAGDPANPELDQLSGRFSPSRGQVGFLACRWFADKDLFWQRCKDTANDRRGWIIPLDDHDLIELVGLVRDGGNAVAEWNFFKSRFDRLI